MNPVWKSRTVRGCAVGEDCRVVGGSGPDNAQGAETAGLGAVNRKFVAVEEDRKVVVGLGRLEDKLKRWVGKASKMAG